MSTIKAHRGVGLARAIQAPTTEGIDTSTTRTPPQDRIGRYDILSAIGAGGMACVYRARMGGPAGASKQVALKVIHAHLVEDRDFVLMFLDEMRLAMALSHRNIVQTFDAGHADERYFMVMELIDGCSLRRLLNRLTGTFPLDTALFIGREVAAALAYAHRFKGHSDQAGVVHRDVSPSNILLSSEGDVKLADFGVAKAAGRLYVSSANLIRGKMQYMSPEQAEGAASAASDLYSLGAVLYELITGQPSRQPVGLDEMLLGTQPTRPSTLREGLPVGLDELVLACLDPDPASRPASAEEVRRALASAALKLQLEDSLDMDPHARLGKVLERHHLLEDETQPTETPIPERRVARAVLAQVRAMETDPELEAVEETAETPPQETLSAVHPQNDASTVVDIVHPEKDASTVVDIVPGFRGDGDAEEGAKTRILTRSARRRRAPRALVLGAALMLAGAGGIFLWLASIPEPEGDRGPRGFRATRQPPDHGVATLDHGGAILDRGTALDHGVREDAPPDHALRPGPAHPRPRRSRSRLPRRPHRSLRPLRPAPPAFGRVDINAVPWARVYIDGRLRGETPLQRVQLPAGTHHVRLVNPRRKLSRSYTVKVVAGQHTSHVFELLKAD